MTPKMDNNLSQIFGTEPSTVLDETKSLVEAKAEAKSADIITLEKQREYVKSNMIKLIEQGMDSLADLRLIAQSSEKSRDFEVLSTMIKTLVESNEALLNIEVAHKPKVDPAAMLQGTGNTMVQNNTTVFVGSTNELGSWLKTLELDDVPTDIEPNDD